MRKHTHTCVDAHTCVHRNTPYMCTCKHTLRVLQAQRCIHRHTHTPPSTRALMYMPVYTCIRTGTPALPPCLGVSGKPQAMGSLSCAGRSILLCLSVLQSTVLRLGWCVMGLVMLEAPKYKWRCP